MLEILINAAKIFKISLAVQLNCDLWDKCSSSKEKRKLCASAEVPLKIEMFCPNNKRKKVAAISKSCQNFYFNEKNKNKNKNTESTKFLRTLHKVHRSVQIWGGVFLSSSFLFTINYWITFHQKITNSKSVEVLKHCNS